MEKISVRRVAVVSAIAVISCAVWFSIRHMMSRQDDSLQVNKVLASVVLPVVHNNPIVGVSPESLENKSKFLTGLRYLIQNDGRIDYEQVRDKIGAHMHSVGIVNSLDITGGYVSLNGVAFNITTYDSKNISLFNAASIRVDGKCITESDVLSFFGNQNQDVYTQKHIHEYSEGNLIPEIESIEYINVAGNNRQHSVDFIFSKVEFSIKYHVCLSYIHIRSK